ncbi:MAG: ribonuclease HI family protein [Patescibacteria group bacterium]|nr:ribonuclease HI family protein [Patescibacteria group bacterium]
MAKQLQITVYTDGGSRGNPGPAAVGIVIKYDTKTKEYAKCIGKKTNNEAEYGALIYALEKVNKLIGKTKAKQADVVCYSDSELMVRQLNHQYKLKNETIKDLFIKIWNLSLDFKSAKFYHIRREYNKQADKLLNQALDREHSKFLF